jgi:hypothetical protein
MPKLTEDGQGNLLARVKGWLRHPVMAAVVAGLVLAFFFYVIPANRR